MTKSKAKESKSSEKFIVRSGSHSRKENGVTTKYECGDEIKLSPEEREQFPLKFISLSEYESIVAADEQRRRDDRAMARATFPPRVRKKGNRSSESIKREKRLLKMRHRNERRTFIS